MPHVSSIGVALTAIAAVAAQTRAPEGGLVLSGETGRIAFGPNKECVLELTSDDELQSNCDVLMPSPSVFNETSWYVLVSASCATRSPGGQRPPGRAPST